LPLKREHISSPSLLLTAEWEETNDEKKNRA
jgi:hypothetical protein